MNAIPSNAASGRTTSILADSPTMTEEQTIFLAQSAMLIGLPLSDGPLLPAPYHFVGPAGLVCRLHMHQDKLAVRLETLLPMSAAELMGQEVNRMLAIQEALLYEYGWYLGLSDEGLLQLSSMGWIDNPCDTARSLDFVNSLGMAVVQTLLHEDSPPTMTVLS